MSDKESGCGAALVGIAILIAIIYGIIKAVLWAAHAYASRFTATGAVLGLLLGGLVGGGLAAGAGALWGNHRRKAEIGPLPMFQYLVPSESLRKRLQRLQQPKQDGQEAADKKA